MYPTRTPGAAPARTPAPLAAPALLVALADPMLVRDGEALGLLRIWSEDQWAALAESDRPRTFVHAPKLGWVGIAPAPDTN